MTTELTKLPEYRSTIDRLEAVKHANPQGPHYWMAREIHGILGYPVWDKFLPVIDKARDSLSAQGVEPSHHIAQTSKLMEVHGGGKRRGMEFFLSRAACYLIAMNGDPSKPEIAGAQAYFAIQTRRAELADQDASDRSRLVKRQRVSKALKDVAAVAKDKGVERFALLNAGRYHGLYEMRLPELLKHKGLKPGDKLLDWAAPLELSAHEFQSNLARERLLKDTVSGEQRALDINKQVASEVRAIMVNNGQPPENLPLAAEPIQALEKRLKRQAALSRSKGPTHE